MSLNRISVSRVLELGVPISWQEAVAIACEVSVQRAAGPALGETPPRIDADACLLTRRGDVVLPFAADTDQHDAEVQLLRALLTGRDMPSDLEEVAYGPAPAYLGDALAMFSRPDRRTDIAAVALRALAAEVELSRMVAPPPPSAPVQRVADRAEDTLAIELARLRAEAGDGDAAPAAAAAAVAPAPRWSSWNRHAIAVAGVLAGAALVTLALRWVGQPALPPSPVVAAAEDPLPADVNDWWHVVGERAGDITLEPRARAARTAPGAGTPTSSAAAVSAAPREPAPRDAAAIADNATVAMPAAAATAPADAAAPDAEPPIYSWRTTDVEPPVMVYPRMPQSAFPEPDAVVDGQYLEVLVSASGAVEAVRLRGTPPVGTPGYHYAMILAAAKAWQFTPATRHDVAVRYVARVVLAP